MLLKVGELAKRSGLTVRTLHHYDSIGLLKPSARSEAGYRLYNRDDIARLHQIQALQRFGLALAEIGTALTGPDSQLPELITRQLSLLTQQIEQADRLRTQLQRLQQQLLRGDEPALAEWLNTLELMNMYDKYFSAEELKRLPQYLGNQQTNAEWAALVKHVQQLIQSNTPAYSHEARAAAQDWFTQVERDTAGDPVLLTKFSEMHAEEPLIQQQSGVTKEMVNYIQQASIHDKLDIYAKYLSPEECAFVKAHYGQHIQEWPPLVADAYQAMQSGQSATSPDTLVIARRWISLTQAIYGPNPDTSLKIRKAHEQEPALLKGSLISDDLLAYLRQAFTHLRDAR